jgi:hypothetical protein
MATSERPSTPAAEPTRRDVHPAWSALVGLTSLGVLLQALWAGLFLRRGDNGIWVQVHQHGGEVTVLLALLATVAAAVWLRGRRDLLAGTALLFVLLVVELLLGMAIGGAPDPVVVHVPLAMLLMGLAVWLPVAARRR